MAVLDQRLRTWAVAFHLISLSSFLLVCIPDCAMAGGFLLPSATGRLQRSNGSYPQLPPGSLAGSLEVSTSASMSPPPLQGNLYPRASSLEPLNSGSVFQDHFSAPSPPGEGSPPFRGQQCSIVNTRVG